MPTIKPTATLPSIVAFIGTHDSGEFGNARCPHCDAEGRYVHTFICDDGTRRGAMSGCIQLFRVGRDWAAKLSMEAFKRKREAEDSGRALASWWQEMVVASGELGDGSIDLSEWRNRIGDAERRRQAWLAKDGYGKFNRRRMAS